LEDFLAEIMSAEFNTVVDDNSLVEVTHTCIRADTKTGGTLVFTRKHHPANNSN